MSQSCLNRLYAVMLFTRLGRRPKSAQMGKVNYSHVLMYFPSSPPVPVWLLIAQSASRTKS